MPRLYISLTDNDFAKLNEISKDVGMSPSAYAAYLVKLGIAPPADEDRNSADMLYLRKTMFDNLHRVGNGEYFIVSALFDSSTWSELPSLQKKQLALELSAYCKGKPEIYSVKKINGLNRYLKK